MECELPEELPSTLIISLDLYCIFYTRKSRKLKENTETFIHWKHFISIQKIFPGFQWTIFISDLKFLPLPEEATEATLKTCLNG